MVRIEKDSLGELELPDDVYYGVQSARAMQNFPVSGIKEPQELIRAYVLLKKAAAQSNLELGVLEKERGKAIIKAADEILDGKLVDQFVIDVYQAGAGTSFNMNTNEVLANRALEILGWKKGYYEYLSPNDHVNMAQSSNDTFPSASHIAVLLVKDELLKVLRDLEEAFIKKGEEFSKIPKSGRTHLMDAMPVSLGAEFRAYGFALERAADRISQRVDDLLEIAVGGTATGTGANAHPKFRETVIVKLSELTGFEFRVAKDSFEALQSRSQLAAFSSALKELGLELIRIANDLRLLGSGPTTGLAEIKLPAVQPGSSIMPGKVNPVMAECLNMIAFQVVGNDTTVGLAAQAGQMDLNVMTPVMIYNILQTMKILTNYLPVFRERCVEGIEADEGRSKAYVDLNPSLATLLNTKIGYLKAAEIYKESLVKNIPVAKLVVEKNILSEAEAKELFNSDKVWMSKYDLEEKEKGEKKL
jgi:aspartate ammonia-lyase